MTEWIQERARLGKLAGVGQSYTAVLVADVSHVILIVLVTLTAKTLSGERSRRTHERVNKLGSRKKKKVETKRH